MVGMEQSYGGVMQDEKSDVKAPKRRIAQFSLTGVERPRTESRDLSVKDGKATPPRPR